MKATYPPFPAGLRGRRTELATLVALVTAGLQRRIALVGPGGSGKSMLASALGHRVRARFPGGLHWLRSGPWDARTLAEMMAIRFGTPREGPGRLAALRTFLLSGGPRFIVLDNHENDKAASELLSELADTPTTWLLTARRCLLAGVYLFPVAAPHATTGRAAFPRVRALTHLLRQNPLALDIAQAIVRSSAVDVDSLRTWLVEAGVERVRVIDHEDDLPEVALLVDWAWVRLPPPARRILAILAHMQGDHLDADSAAKLAGLSVRAGLRALQQVSEWNLVQQPLPERYALHAVVRYAVARRTHVSQRKLAAFYLDLLEREPERLDLEQTHLYAAMDVAHNESRLDWMLRIETLMATLANGRPC